MPQPDLSDILNGAEEDRTRHRAEQVGGGQAAGSATLSGPDNTVPVGQLPIDDLRALIVGSAATGLTFDYTQSTPAAVWTIAHQLGGKPDVKVFSTTGQSITTEVQWPDPSTVLVKFGKPTAGTAHLDR